MQNFCPSIYIPLKTQVLRYNNKGEARWVLITYRLVSLMFTLRIHVIIFSNRDFLGKDRSQTEAEARKLAMNERELAGNFITGKLIIPAVKITQYFFIYFCL